MCYQANARTVNSIGNRAKNFLIKKPGKLYFPPFAFSHWLTATYVHVLKGCIKLKQCSNVRKEYRYGGLGFCG